MFMSRDASYRLFEAVEKALKAKLSELGELKEQMSCAESPCAEDPCEEENNDYVCDEIIERLNGMQGGIDAIFSCVNTLSVKLDELDKKVDAMRPKRKYVRRKPLTE